MSRRTTVALLGVWTVVAFVVWAVFFGGRVEGCLGPLNVTRESCRAGLGLPPLTDWDRFLEGPGVLAVGLLVGWLAIILIARMTRTRRQRGGL